MTDERLDRQLDDLLGAYFAPLADEVAPATLRANVDAMPDRFPVRRGWLATLRSRPILLLATLALLLALAITAAILSGSKQRVPVLPGMGLIAFDSGGDIVEANRDGTNRHAITSDPAADFGPSFSPDGARIAFWSQAAEAQPGAIPDKLASTALVVANADGSSPHVLVDGIVYPEWTGPRWSADGRFLAYSSDEPSGVGSQVVVAAIDGSAPVVVAGGIASRSEARWAPDSPTLAYLADGALHLVNADGSADRVVIPSDVSSDARWSPDGARLSYTTDLCCGPLPDTWVVDRNGGNPHAITDSTGTETFGGWSSDGRSTVITRSQPDGSMLVLVADADGQHPRTLDVTGATGTASWSVDGLSLLVLTTDGLLVVDPSGVRAPVSIAADMPLGVSWQPVGPRTAIAARSPTVPSRGGGPSPVPQGTPGTRRSTSGFAIPFSFDAALLPGGITETYGQWAVGSDAYVVGQGDFGIAAYADPRLFADPCHPSAGFARSGTTPAELAAALKMLHRLKVSGPMAVTIGGYEGVSVDLESTTDAARCEDPHHLHVLETETGVDEVYDLAGEGWSTSPGELSVRPAPAGGGIYSRWLILDVHGARLVLEAWTAGESPTSLIGGIKKLEQTLESITFE